MVEYTLSVPYTENVEQTYAVSVPVLGGTTNDSDSSFSIDALSAWTLDGKALSNQALRKRLQEGNVGFLFLHVDQPPSLNQTRIVRALCKPETLMIYFKPKKYDDDAKPVTTNDPSGD